LARTSTAGRSTRAVRIDRRPAPPPDLTADQAEIWQQTVGSETSDFFKTAALCELLKNYCRHTATVVEIDHQIASLPAKAMLHKDFGKVFERLLKMRERETKAAADKATKLRLTNQSRYTPQAASTAAKRSGGKQPWDFK
jgi:thiamine pyrophosphate-dependent acetolactate synthase large subunit-like protein